MSCLSVPHTDQLFTCFNTDQLFICFNTDQLFICSSYLTAVYPLLILISCVPVLNTNICLLVLNNDQLLTCTKYCSAVYLFFVLISCLPVLYTDQLFICSPYWSAVYLFLILISCYINPLTFSLPSFCSGCSISSLIGQTLHLFLNWIHSSAIKWSSYGIHIEITGFGTFSVRVIKWC